MVRIQVYLVKMNENRLYRLSEPCRNYEQESGQIRAKSKRAIKLLWNGRQSVFRRCSEIYDYDVTVFEALRRNGGVLKSWLILNKDWLDVKSGLPKWFAGLSGRMLADISVVATEERVSSIFMARCRFTAELFEHPGETPSISIVQRATRVNPQWTPRRTPIRLCLSVNA